MIEERYKEVTELAKQAIKSDIPSKDEIITIENHGLITNKKKNSPKAETIHRLAVDHPAQRIEKLSSKQDDGSSSKTLPKKPPVKKKKSDVGQGEIFNKKVIGLDDSGNEHPAYYINPGKTEIKPIAQERIDDKPVRKRYLLPQRGNNNLMKAILYKN